jgi:hypothetical protein
MTKELPPLINKELKTNGRNAVGGLSSTGGTAIDDVGSYSGFPAPSDPDAAQQVSLGGGGRAVKSAAAVAVGMWRTRARTDRTTAVGRQPDAGRSP